MVVLDDLLPLGVEPGVEDGVLASARRRRTARGRPAARARGPRACGRSPAAPTARVASTSTQTVASGISERLRDSEAATALRKPLSGVRRSPAPRRGVCRGGAAVGVGSLANRECAHHVGAGDHAARRPWPRRRRRSMPPSRARRRTSGETTRRRLRRPAADVGREPRSDHDGCAGAGPRPASSPATAALGGSVADEHVARAGLLLLAVCLGCGRSSAGLAGPPVRRDAASMVISGAPTATVSPCACRAGSRPGRRTARAPRRWTWRSRPRRWSGRRRPRRPLHEPTDDLGLGEALAEVREPEHLGPGCGGHEYSHCRSSTASRIRSTLGRWRCSKLRRRIGDVEPGDPSHRRGQGVEAPLGDPGRDLGGDAGEAGGLGDDDRPAGGADCRRRRSRRRTGTIERTSTTWRLRPSWAATAAASSAVGTDGP